MEVTRVGTIYPANSNPMSSLYRGRGLKMEEIQMWTDGKKFTQNSGFTHVILRVDPARGSSLTENITANNYLAKTISVSSEISKLDVFLCGIIICCTLC